MLFWLGEHLREIFGPFRLLQSHLVLASAGLAGSALLVGALLPRSLPYLPVDRGRLYSYDGTASRGKPTAAGVVFIPVFLAVAALVVPWDPALYAAMGCVGLAMLSGYLDDRGAEPWGDYRKASIDLLVALLTALAVCPFVDREVWLPFWKGSLLVPPALYLPFATALLWISINATNCTDGVDGLSGSLLSLALLYLGAILYGVVGHERIAAYLLVPHYERGAAWGILAFTLLGTLAGYLWYNAHPSVVLMGDAGSRPLGLLLGALVLASGNPFLILIVAGVVLVNGGTGLLKVALLRFFDIGILRSIRFPLHDHYQQLRGWSKSQVLMRFMILQAVLTPLLIVLLLKVR